MRIFFDFFSSCYKPKPRTRTRTNTSIRSKQSPLSDASTTQKGSVIELLINPSKCYEFENTCYIVLSENSLTSTHSETEISYSGTESSDYSPGSEAETFSSSEYSDYSSGVETDLQPQYSSLDNQIKQCQKKGKSVFLVIDPFINLSPQELDKLSKLTESYENTIDLQNLKKNRFILKLFKKLLSASGAQLPYIRGQLQQHQEFYRNHLLFLNRNEEPDFESDKFKIAMDRKRRFSAGEKIPKIRKTP